MLLLLFLTLFSSFLPGFIEGFTNPVFINVTEIYKAQFDNCSITENSMKQCLSKYGACLVRTDTIERQPFCICIDSRYGARCELNLLPLSMDKFFSSREESNDNPCNVTTSIGLLSVYAILLILTIFSSIMQIIVYKYSYKISEQSSTRSHNDRANTI